MNTTQYRKLPESFYQKSALEIAPKLLGKLFIKKEEEQFLAGKIVEVEAYAGVDDEASHSFGGETKRNSVMFASGGALYVYFIYGNHYCANVVCDRKDVGAAVLIRAVEPISGAETMAHRRFQKSELTAKELINLTNGPGKICKAFNISKRDDGKNLCGEEIFIAEGEKILKDQIVRTTRIGIQKSKELPWRFYLKESRFISAK